MKVDKNAAFLIQFVLIFLVSTSASVLFNRLFDMDLIYGVFAISGIALIFFVYYVRKG